MGNFDNVATGKNVNVTVAASVTTDARFKLRIPE
jgi:hypothetical protein